MENDSYLDGGTCERIREKYTDIEILRLLIQILIANSVRVSDMQAQIVPEEGIRNLEIPECKDDSQVNKL
jgi:hypothetical protein